MCVSFVKLVTIKISKNSQNVLIPFHFQMTSERIFIQSVSEFLIKKKTTCTFLSTYIYLDLSES